MRDYQRQKKGTNLMGKIKEDFLSVRSFITLGAFLTIYGLTWLGKMQVDIVVRIADILLGYWFGSKVASAIKNAEIKKGDV
jgi:hypothetical protein